MVHRSGKFSTGKNSQLTQLGDELKDVSKELLNFSGAAERAKEAIRCFAGSAIPKDSNGLNRNGSTPDMQQMSEFEDRWAQKMLSVFNGVLGFSQQILNLFGESKSEVAQIISMLQQLSSTVSSGASLINDIGSMIGAVGRFFAGGPAGAVVGAAAGGALSGGMPNINSYSGSNRNVHNITVVVNSEIEKSKAYTFLSNHMPVYNAKVAQKSV